MDQLSYSQEVRRKLVHLSSLWMVAALLLLPRMFCVWLFGAMALLTIALEYAHYRKVRGVWRVYDFFFGKMLREYDPGKFHPSGGAPVLAAACISTLLFRAPFSGLAMAVMLLADTAAALIGKKFGKRRFFNGKSAIGTFAFLATGAMVILAGFLLFDYGSSTLLGGLAGVVAAAALEFFNRQLHLDDNFTIPLAVGTGLWLGALL